MDQDFDHIGEHELDAKTKQELRKVTQNFFDRPLSKAQAFDWEEFKRNEAFKAIMMPSPLFWTLGSFERSFTQKLGQQMYEEFGKAVANANEEVGTAETQYTLEDLELTAGQEGKIESIIAALSGGDRDPDWEREKQDVKTASEGQLKSAGSITWDLWVDEFHNGRALAAEIKTPKPNRDQTMESKRQMLKTIAAYEHRSEPAPIVRYVFPFNPYGSVEAYNWWPPQSFFNVKEVDGMMIADGFWNAIGGERTMEGLFNFLLEESEGNIETLTELAGDSTL